MKITALVGSLRAASYNRQLLQAMIPLAPPSLEITEVNLANIPIYNQEVEDAGTPQPILDFKKQLGEADGLLMISPEYNHSVSGILKNALDWASRKPTANVIAGKVIAIGGATDGNFGTVHAQRDLRWILGYLGANVMPKPDLFVSKVDTKFKAGILTDADLEASLRLFLTQFEWYLQRFQTP